MYDPELKYCPECRDEYRAEIERCAECGCRLLSGSEMSMGDEGMVGREIPAREIGDGEEMVAIRNGPLAEIRSYGSLLERHGIPSLLGGDPSSCGRGCRGGIVDLMVGREDLGRAVAMIEEEIRRTSRIGMDHHSMDDRGFDPLAADNVCPACGHRFSGGVSCPDCGLCF